MVDRQILALVILTSALIIKYYGLLNLYEYTISLLLLYFRQTHGGYFIVLYTIPGSVERGNFTYYSLAQMGDVSINLTSIVGDADIYVTEGNKKPTFDPETFDLHSASCGEDIVHIPHTFKRPIGIGIYGHPSHEISTYLLEVHVSLDRYPSNDPFIEDNPNEPPPKKPTIETPKQNRKIQKYNVLGKLLGFLGKALPCIEFFSAIFN